MNPPADLRKSIEWVLVPAKRVQRYAPFQRSAWIIRKISSLCKFLKTDVKFEFRSGQKINLSLRSVYRNRVCFYKLWSKGVACVAWRFCRAGRPRNSRAKRARKNKNQLLRLQSPRGFSALARLCYLATKTAMLRRLRKERYPWIMRYFCYFENKRTTSVLSTEWGSDIRWFGNNNGSCVRGWTKSWSDIFGRNENEQSHDWFFTIRSVLTEVKSRNSGWFIVRFYRWILFGTHAFTRLWFRCIVKYGEVKLRKGDNSQPT